MKVYWTTPEHIKFAPRPEQLEPKRVTSVFKERVDKLKEEQEEIAALVNGLNAPAPADVPWRTPEAQAMAQQLAQQDPAAAARVYYEQYTIKGPITVKRGDTVYVRSENGKNLIAQIDTMWTEK